MEPSATSIVVRNRTEFNSIPLDVEDLWIGRFDTSDIYVFTPNRFKSLKTLVIGNGTLWSVNKLYLNNLTSLQILYIGDGCFYYALSFSLTGLIYELVWTHRTSSTTICNSWHVRILVCTIDCIWEWLNEWIDDSDLPKLQSILLYWQALQGDQDNRGVYYKPFNFRNILTMRSEIEWVDEWIDLPSLTEFKGDYYNFGNIGSVILESMDVVFDWCRYPSINIWWNLLR